MNICTPGFAQNSNINQVLCPLPLLKPTEEPEFTETPMETVIFRSWCLWIDSLPGLPMN